MYLLVTWDHRGLAVWGPEVAQATKLDVRAH